jgi:micrococcal nuclease
MIYIYKADLIRVVDGDTVDLVIDLGFDTFRHERFRLYGVDAPEMNTEAGKEAKAWLIGVLGPYGAIYVQTVQLETKAKRDKYGRFLAVLYDELPKSLREIVNGQKILVDPLRFAPGEVASASINAKMVVEGHAKERYW